MAGMKKYGRKYRVIVADENNAGLDVSNLHCTFVVNKAAIASPSTLELIIYNLAPDAENLLLTEGYRVMLEAGYQGLASIEKRVEDEDADNTTTTVTESVTRDVDENGEEELHAQEYGKIFDGLVLQIFRQQEDATTYTLHIIALDGDDFYYRNFSSRTILRGQTQREVLENVTANASIPTPINRITPTLSESVLPRGKVIFGDTKEVVKKIAKNNSAQLYVEAGEIYIEKLVDEIPEDSAIVISPQTGLIGSPEQTNDGVAVTTLMNPLLQIMGLFKIDNSLVRQTKINLGNLGQVSTLPLALDADGQYRIIQITHRGDTRGDEWYTTVIGVGMVGRIPTMLSSINGNPG